MKCWYSTRGVEVDGNTAQMLTSGSSFYSDSTTIPHVHIGMSEIVRISLLYDTPITHLARRCYGEGCGVTGRAVAGRV